MTFLKLIPNALSSKVGLAVLKLSKHSPNILFAGGVVGVVGTVVLASRATLRLEEVLDKTQESLDKVNEVGASVIEDPTNASFTEKEILQAKIGVYIQAAGQITKLYGPSVALGALSIAALTKSHFILTKRNAALAAALTAVEKGFRAYRDRVIEDLGAEKDRDYYYGLEKQKEVTIDSEGKKKIVERKIQTGTSPYGVMFNCHNRNWVDSPEHNIIFLKLQQNNLNDLLNARGWVLLNDLYDALGFDRTKAGCVVGWKLGQGDGYVDFGVFVRENLGQYFDYVTGREGEIHINPNVDGNIFNSLKD